MSKPILFARTFPKTHPRAGQPTNFVSAILKSMPNALYYNKDLFTKKHTIRRGFSRKVGDVFSPRVWNGVPRRSKHRLICPDLTITQIYNIRILVQDFGKLGLQATIHINGRWITDMTEVETLANNDGLSVEDFVAWFHNPDEEVFEGQVICWTNDAIYNP